MKDILAVVKFRNFPLYEKIKQYSMKQIGLAIGCNPGTIGALLSLRQRARYKFREPRGEFIPTALKLAEFFNVDPAELFPETLDELTLPRSIEKAFDSTSFVSLGAARSLHVLPEYVEEIDANDLKKAIPEVLKTLNPRERKILTSRFGLDGNGEKSLEEIGGDFALHRERIRQIESKALRHLRHPERSGKLRKFLPSIGEDPLLGLSKRVDKKLLAEFVCFGCGLVYSSIDLSTPHYSIIRCRCGSRLRRITDLEKSRLRLTMPMYCELENLLKPEFCQRCSHHASRHIDDQCSICGSFHKFLSCFKPDGPFKPYR